MRSDRGETENGAPSKASRAALENHSSCGPSSTRSARAPRLGIEQQGPRGSRDRDGAGAASPTGKHVARREGSTRDTSHAR